jgi:hypothetical protein
MFARPLAVGQEKRLDRTRHLYGTDGEHVETRVVLRRIAGSSSETEDRFLILATWGLNPDGALRAALGN